MSAVLFLMLLVPAGFSADDEMVIGSMSDLYQQLPPPDATRWDASEVVAAIGRSEYRFSPADVYDLVDRKAPERVLRAVCGKAGEPFDPAWRPLEEVAAEARKGQPKTTMELNEQDISKLFTTLESLESEVKMVERQLPPLAARKSGETDRLYERRVRRHQVDKARALGPAQGRIEATTFIVTLPATQASRKGCVRPVATVDVSGVGFSTFRAGMGTKHRTNEVKLTSATVELAEFNVNQGFRFEVQGRCGEQAELARIEMSRTHDGRWSGRGEIR